MNDEGQDQANEGDVQSYASTHGLDTARSLLAVQNLLLACNLQCCFPCSPRCRAVLLL